MVRNKHINNQINKIKGNNRESPDYLKNPNLPNNNFSFKSCYKYSSPRDITIDKDLYEKINKFTEKNNLPITKTSKFEEKTERNYFEMINPVINSNQSSYLKNLNEYHIKENYNLDENRQFKHFIKHKNNYDIVANAKNFFSPLPVKIDKWPRYYEK